MPTISLPGLGAPIDVDVMVSKLMIAEAIPLQRYANQTASFQTQLSALGQFSGALSTFQSSLSSLSTLSSFQSRTATSNNTSILVGNASSSAISGQYNISVSKVAQAQTLASAGQASTTATIGSGNTTTLFFQLGNVSGGFFGTVGATLGAGTITGGVTPGGLTINGTTINTDGNTKSAKLLADAVNAQSNTTGVSAKAAATSTAATLFGANGASSFGAVDTSTGGTYTLSVGGVAIATQASGVAGGGASALSAAGLDAILGGTNNVTESLAAANITFTGKAADGTLQFVSSDGNNITVAEAVTGNVTGGINNRGGANTGSIVTASSSISLVSAAGNQITVGGTNPAAAGLTAGMGGSYLGASYAQDGTQPSGSVVINSTNNTLKGIADAINKANVGVRASIISDGSSTPYHIVLTSNSTGANSTMKISLSGGGGIPPDPALASLLSYDASNPAGQNMSQNSAAQSTQLTVGGIPITSTSRTVSDAIQGVTLTVGQVGNSLLDISADNSSLSSSVQGFVKGYNTLNSAVAALTGYNADTKSGGPLMGNSTVTNLLAAVRRQMSTPITGLTTDLTSLTQIGIEFQKDGSLTLDNTKLQNAITNNFGAISGLFAALGTGTDTQVKFLGSTAATKPGDYALNISTMARQGSMTGSAPLAATTTIAPDTSWTVSLNDTNPSSASNIATIAIPAGNYTPTQLAALLQSSINGASNFSKAGSAVTVSLDPTGALVVTSNLYGSASNLLLSNSGAGTAVTDLFGSAAPLEGLDVAGTIGGYTATGKGQVLTGGKGAPIEGMKLEISGGTTGDRGTVGFSQGYAYQLTNLANNYLGSSGLINAANKSINASIKDITDQANAFSARLDGIKQRYLDSFNNLTQVTSALNKTQIFLTAQLANLNKN